MTSRVFVSLVTDDDPLVLCTYVLAHNSISLIDMLYIPTVCSYILCNLLHLYYHIYSKTGHFILCIHSPYHISVLYLVQPVDWKDHIRTIIYVEREYVQMWTFHIIQ